MRISTLLAASCVLSLSLMAERAFSAELRVAVAANFLSTLQALETPFESATDHDLAIISGSTGLLYAQIRSGAPFDVLLAADQRRPQLLADDDFGDPASVFTYAIGRLALWSRDPALITSARLDQFSELRFRWLAIAEPGIAPYGIAARQTLERLGVWSALQARIVKGQNVAQTFAMIATGNAELGFVALSQVLARAGDASYVIVTDEYHDPIRQDAIVLNRARHNTAATAFVEFLKSQKAAAIIERNGYATMPAQ